MTVISGELVPVYIQMNISTFNVQDYGCWCNIIIQTKQKKSHLYITNRLDLYKNVSSKSNSFSFVKYEVFWVCCMLAVKTFHDQCNSGRIMSNVYFDTFHTVGLKLYPQFSPTKRSWRFEVIIINSISNGISNHSTLCHSKYTCRLLV